MFFSENVSVVCDHVRSGPSGRLRSTLSHLICHPYPKTWDQRACDTRTLMLMTSHPNRLKVGRVFEK